ncbi:hypothetical protein M0R19_03920 [Candidatus Pacearchaeota archaeon]|nr:hypothetical protein [Candidatus Pacearchaeota archaeon]
MKVVYWKESSSGTDIIFRCQVEGYTSLKEVNEVFKDWKKVGEGWDKDAIDFFIFKRTFPSTKELTEFAKQTNYQSYYKKDSGNLVLLSSSKKEEENKEEVILVKKQRKCSVCGQTGHNKTKCPIFRKELLGKN